MSQPPHPDSAATSEELTFDVPSYDWIRRPDTAEFDAFLIELSGEPASGAGDGEGGDVGDDSEGSAGGGAQGSPASRLAFKIGLVVTAAVAIWAVVVAIRPDSDPRFDSVDGDQDSALLEVNPIQDDVGRQLRVQGTVPPSPEDGDNEVTGTESDSSAESDPDATTAGADDENAESDDNGDGASDGVEATDNDVGDAASGSSTQANGDAQPDSTPVASPTEGSAPTASAAVVGTSADYQSNLAMIKSASVRNTNLDGSPYRATPMDQLVLEDHYGPRSEYLNNPGMNPEHAFPVAQGGQFRTACEFSHFSYDDPLVYPGRPGAAHLHMFFGNTDVNAFSTYDTLFNSGSGTCNGQELNRTGYWVPAMFDGNGNVRVPERIVVYYKGEGLARKNAEVYPPGAAMITDQNINEVGAGVGGAKGKFSFVCSENFSGASQPASNTMPACDGSKFKNLYGVDENPHVVLEMNVKFPQCWNGKDPSNPDNFAIPTSGGWYYSLCEGEFNRTLTNLEYFVNYKVDIGENTSNWYLSSDVDPTSFGTAKAQGGSTIHGDWWGAWNPKVNEMFINNCVKLSTGTPSGCGFGYLTDGGPNGKAPKDGPALKIRQQYTGPHKVPASQIFAELCPKPSHSFNRAEDAAYCAPGSGF